MASRKVSFGGGLFVGALLLLGVTVFFNKIIGDLRIGRFDLTEDKIYTVSEGAKNILAKLDVPVQVKYYVTSKDAMPAGLKTMQQDVADKLSELSIASRGNLEYQIVDPQESEELEDALISKGIQPFQVQSVDKDQVALKRVYSAISIGYKDKADEIIPQVLPDNLTNFEYELVSKVMKIVREQPPQVAIKTSKEAVNPEMARLYMQMGQPMPEPADNFQLSRELLRQEGYDVVDVVLTRESSIDSTIDTFVLLGNDPLDERQRYEIYEVLARGGNVIIAGQGLVYDYAPGSRGGFNITVRSQPLAVNELLTEFGVRIDDKPLMDEQMATLQIPRTQNFGGLRLQVAEPIQVPMQIRVLGEGVNPDLPITAGVPEVLYLWGTRVVVDETATGDLSVTPILSGSSNSWLVDKKSGPMSGPDFDPEGHETIERPLLAALIEGVFPNPWQGKPVPSWGGAPDTTGAARDTAMAPTGEPGRLLVLGCAKMFEDMLLEQQAHALFLLNAVDALSLGDDVISIRSKAFDRRTIGETSDGKRLAFRVANMALVPIAVVVFGLVRLVARRREEEVYTAQYQAAGGKR